MTKRRRNTTTYCTCRCACHPGLCAKRGKASRCGECRRMQCSTKAEAKRQAAL